MEIKIVKDKISLNEVKRMAKDQYGNMIKAVVDVEKGIMALGGELHADANALLTKEGSDQRRVWGFNILPEKPRMEWLEFNSLINIKPTEGNFDMEIEPEEIKKKIREITDKLIQ